MPLFSCATNDLIEAAPRIISTPVGDITSYLTAVGVDTRTMEPTEACALENGGKWYCWKSEDFRAELILTPYDPRLDPELEHVEGSEVAIWRVQSDTELLKPLFACAWVTLPDGATGGSDTGQYEHYWRWDIGTLAVNIGTTDGDGLKFRADAGGFIPKRLSPELHINTGGLVYDGTPIEFDVMEDFSPDGPLDINLVDGLLMSFSSLENGEVLEIVFTVAWTYPKNEDDLSTHFAMSPGPYLIK